MTSVSPEHGIVDCIMLAGSTVDEAQVLRDSAMAFLAYLTSDKNIYNSTWQHGGGFSS